RGDEARPAAFVDEAPRAAAVHRVILNHRGILEEPVERHAPTALGEVEWFGRHGRVAGEIEQRRGVGGAKKVSVEEHEAPQDCHSERSEESTVTNTRRRRTRGFFTALRTT